VSMSCLDYFRHSRPYDIFWRFDLLLSSSSSAVFFFLPPLPILLPLEVAWLFSRVGNEEVGAGACEGVVAGVEASCRVNVSVWTWKTVTWHGMGACRIDLPAESLWSCG